MSEIYGNEEHYTASILQFLINRKYGGLLATRSGYRRTEMEISHKSYELVFDVRARTAVGKQRANPEHIPRFFAFAIYRIPGSKNWFCDLDRLDS